VSLRIRAGFIKFDKQKLEFGMGIVTSTPAKYSGRQSAHYSGGGKFEPAHAGGYDGIDGRPACRGIRSPAGANGTPTSGHDARACLAYDIRSGIIFSWMGCLANY
jgi:hypothetical protein